MLTIISATPVLVVKGGLESEVCTVTFSRAINQTDATPEIHVLSNDGKSVDNLITVTPSQPSGNEIKATFKAAANAVVTPLGQPRKISFRETKPFNGVDCLTVV